MKLNEEIARTAHELYMKSGCIAGRDLENWVEAERIVKARCEAGAGSAKCPESRAAAPAAKKAVTAAAKESAVPKKVASSRKTPAKRTAKTKKTE